MFHACHLLTVISIDFSLKVEMRSSSKITFNYKRITDFPVDNDILQIKKENT